MKTKRTSLLVALSVLFALIAGVMLAGCTQDGPAENVSYTVTVNCAAPSLLKGTKVGLYDMGGTKVAETALTGNKATFSLPGGEYRAELVGLEANLPDGADDIDVSKPANLTASAPDAQIAVTTAEGMGLYEVTARYPDGKPLANGFIQLCMDDDSCYPQETNADGVALFYLARGSYHVKLTVEPEGYTLDETKYTMGPESGALTVELTAKA